MVMTIPPIKMSMHGVRVTFKVIQSNTWSKPYTYKSILSYEKGDVVVVETGNFYSVGRVVESIPNYDFNPDLTYKNIVMKVVV